MSRWHAYTCMPRRPSTNRFRIGHWDVFFSPSRGNTVIHVDRKMICDILHSWSGYGHVFVGDADASIPSCAILNLLTLTVQVPWWALGSLGSQVPAFRYRPNVLTQFIDEGYANAWGWKFICNFAQVEKLSFFERRFGNSSISQRPNMIKILENFHKNMSRDNLLFLQ